MKKLSILACLAAFVWSCAESESLRVPDAEVVGGSPMSAVRSDEEAIACALDAFATFYGTSRSLALIKDVRCFTSPSESRSSDNDTLFYVVNTEDNQGYAVIAASRAETPVLAVTERGNIENLDDIENPGAAMFFDALRFNADNLRPIDSTAIIRPNPWWSGGDPTPGIYPPTPRYKENVDIQEYKVEPRANLAWGQERPEGLLFPNKVAGCGNIATMLVFSYFEYPTSLYKDSRVYLNWEIIKQHKQSGYFKYRDECGDDSTALAHSLLSRACYTLSRMNGSMYEDGGTPTPLKNLYNNISQYHITSELYSGMPCAYESIGDGIIFVAADRGAKKTGHAFIIDGYHHRVTTVEQLKQEPGKDGWEVIGRSVSSLSYNHINWGWNGLDNGYFRKDIYDTAKAESYDGFHLGDSLNYIRNFKYFVVTRR